RKARGARRVRAHTRRDGGQIPPVPAGHGPSCQYHEHKDETMHVLSGEVILRLWADRDAPPSERVMRPGESVHVTPFTIHSIEAVVDSDVLEASTPELDDVVRLRDLYGRA